jgi:isoquinoline 1-oxidoreductase subunit beta
MECESGRPYLFITTFSKAPPPTGTSGIVRRAHSITARGQSSGGCQWSATVQAPPSKAGTKVHVGLSPSRSSAWCTGTSHGTVWDITTIKCIDTVRALQVQWAPGAAAGMSDADVLADLITAELPMTPALGQTLDQRFTFYFRPGDPLETNCAVADVRPGSAEVWSAMKSPIYFQETVAQILGLPVSSVTAHVTQGGGSFGRHLFADAAFEAAAISKAIGKPVKLMWHRTDNFRQGRVHPMCTSRVRVTYLGDDVLTFDQRHTSVATDFTHGLGEILSATLGDLPEGDFLGYSQSVFTLTANVPYNFGPVTQLLNEVYHPPGSVFNTSSVRNIYSPEVTVAKELMVDQVAAAMRRDPYQFRRSFVRDPRILAVPDTAATVANGASPWRRSPPRESVSITSTRATPRAWPRSTARQRPSTGRSRMVTRGRGSRR